MHRLDGLSGREISHRLGLGRDTGARLAAAGEVVVGCGRGVARWLPCKPRICERGSNGRTSAARGIASRLGLSPTRTPSTRQNGGDLEMTATIDHRELYRLPSSLPDSPIAWLEPTRKCDLAYLGRYRGRFGDFGEMVPRQR